ncbi:MAG: class I SAM-dependent RNA methyltransferase [Proteobacteria bacterium]|nr:class I SAM-dependent RNA methyltransferase [Pseudomonadota bacterium]
MADEVEFSITRLGAQGDGVADLDGRSIFVPFTLPGDQVIADIDGDRGRLLRILEPSPERISPICRHFGKCGGCSVQHLAPDAYAIWKRTLVIDAFKARGLDPEVHALEPPEGQRRRAALKAQRTEGGIEIGFHAAASHELIGIEECPVLEPKLVMALPTVAKLIMLLLPKRTEVRVVMTLTRSGLDVEIDGTQRKLTPEIRSQLAIGATRIGLARLVVSGDVVVETLQPFMQFGPADVPLPPAVFVQAVEAAETAIANHVVTALGKAKRVADLFCGLGAFTFPIAMRARVSAYDGSKPAIAALAGAAKKTSGLKPIDAIVRDLFRDPLSTVELNQHDAVVFDPPRAGAEAQSQRLAKSKVKTVVAVSCNPATLARDARHLVDGGFKIESVTPVDQFVYSAHVEVVAVFRR